MQISEEEFKKLSAYQILLDKCADYYIDLNDYKFHAVTMEQASDNNTGAYIAVHGLAQYIDPVEKRTLAYDFMKLAFEQEWKLNDFRLINAGCLEGLYEDEED